MMDGIADDTPLGQPQDASEIDIEAAYRRATDNLAPQHSARAAQAAKNQATALVQMLSARESREEAVANRLVSAREAALGMRLEETGDSIAARELEKALVLRLGLVHLGAALLRVGEERRRPRELVEAAHVLGAAAFSVGPPLNTHAAACISAKGGLFERQAFGMWSRCIEILIGHSSSLPVSSSCEASSKGSGPEATSLVSQGQLQRLHSIGVARNVWLHPMQRPIELLQRGLASRPFWDPRELPAAQALEAAFGDILAELRALREGYDSEGGFSAYRSRVVDRGAWQDCQLFALCRKDTAHCEACPQTAAAITAQPGFNTMIFGSCFFSRLSPGTHLAAHCGPSNLRLRVHLGLEIPKGCRIRCGEEVREWRAGEALVFDDSFEHEVWYDRDEDEEGSGGGRSSDRIVLICDLWHPGVDLTDHVYPMLDEEQIGDLEAARRGEHRAITERGYSTGETVRREP